MGKNYDVNEAGDMEEGDDGDQEGRQDLTK